MARIVILGAGLTGLSTAYHLEQAGYTDYLIFEKEATPGGLCRSVTTHGFTFDYTGHLLHSNDAATRPLVDLCVGKNNLTTATRSAWIESNGIQTPYPFQMYLHGRSPEVLAECIEGFVTRNYSTRQPRMFTDWVESAFGKGFGKHFFYPYQRKIFSYSPRKLTATWTGRFVPKTDLATIIRSALTPHTHENVGYNATFLYPKRGGIQSLIAGLTQNIQQPIHTGFCATSIDTKNKIITFANGHQETYDQLVSTLPLDELLTMLDGTHTQKLQSAASNLLCTSVLNINVGVVNTDITTMEISSPRGSNANPLHPGTTNTQTTHASAQRVDTHNYLPNASWIYYPDTTTSWYRIGFPHSFAASACPDGTQSLYAEFSYLNKQKKSCTPLRAHNAHQSHPKNTRALADYAELLHNSSQPQTKNYARHCAQRETELLRHFNIPPDALVARAPLILDHAYVIYNTWRDAHVPRLLNRLASDYAIHSIGRYGAWKYASMQEALVDGKTTAHLLTSTFIPAHLSTHRSRRSHEAPSTTSTHTDTHPTLPTQRHGDEHEA